jgi:hypothetical protein
MSPTGPRRRAGLASRLERFAPLEGSLAEPEPSDLSVAGEPERMLNDCLALLPSYRIFTVL